MRQCRRRRVHGGKRHREAVGGSVYRLTRHGVFVGEYKTPEELAKVADLAELVDDMDVDGPV
jgi:hypothetical protein